MFLFVSTSALLASVNLKDLQLSTAHALVAQSLGSEASLSGRAPREYLQALIDGLCDLSLKDPLTGLPNRRFIRAVLDSEIDRVARSGEAALLLMLDIDHFKQVNDRHGHGAGDLVLQSVAQTLQTCLRPMDTVARYGGEEFAIVLPACQFGFGRVVAERVRRAVEATPIAISPSLSVNVTVSIGGAFALQWIRSTVPLWAERADAELYKAKAGGRNRISIEEQPDSTVTAEEKSMLFGPLYTPSGWGELPPPLDPPAYSAY
ncbi:GGDEF domain-containing protein [Pulveribacter sp.]|uniref:GGDEF domain-containing protein n=1 Tax=Pulveribacter sp. TaxID=2678893 RepID=UPI0039182059